MTTYINLVHSGESKIQGWGGRQSACVPIWDGGGGGGLRVRNTPEHFKNANCEIRQLDYINGILKFS